MLMRLVVLGRIAVFKHAGDTLFIAWEKEIVKCACAADYELEEKKNPSFLKTAMFTFLCVASSWINWPNFSKW